MTRSSQFFPLTAGDINIYHARLIANQQISFVVEFSNCLDIERLNTALFLLHEALPILSSILKTKGAHYKRIWLPDFKPAIAIVNNPEDPHQELTCFIGTPCDPETEPPAKFLLLRNHNEDTLCVKSDHTVTDASGLRFLLSLFAEAYSQGAISQSINPCRGLRQIFRKFSLTTIVRAINKGNMPHPGPPLINGLCNTDRTFTEQVCIEPEFFKSLNLKAKEASATLNDVFLAAIYEVIFQYLPLEEGRGFPVMVPIDMRRYLAEEKRGVLANLSSAIVLKLTRIPGETFSDTLYRVKIQVDDLKQDNLGLGELVLVGIGAGLKGHFIRKRYESAAVHGSRFLVVTNFGILDQIITNFGEIPIKTAYGIGPIQYGSGILIALSTCQQTLHLVIQCKGDEECQGAIRQLLGDIQVALQL